MISKYAYIARALARNPKASKRLAAKAWNLKHRKHLVPKAFDKPETADLVYKINNISPYNEATLKLTKVIDNAIRATTGVKGHMPYKLAHHERKVREGLGPLWERKTPLKGQFTGEQLGLILKAFANTKGYTKV